MRSALEADHSDQESDAEAESQSSSFKRANPAQLAKMQLHDSLTKAGRSKQLSGSGSGSESPSPGRSVGVFDRLSGGGSRGTSESSG